MARIVVTPHRLRELARLLRQTADTLDTLRDKLNQAYSGLHWEVRGRDVVEERVRQAMVVSVTVTGNLTYMAHFLERAAQRFEEADRQRASELAKVWTGYHQAMTSSPPRWDLSLQQHLKEQGRFFEVPSINLSSLPGYGTAVGIAALLPSISQTVTSWVERFWNWLFPPKAPHPTSPPKMEDVPGVQRGRLTEIIRRGLEKKTKSLSPKERLIDTIEISTQPSRGSLPISLEEAQKRLRANPAMSSMWRQVDAPIKSTPGQRSPDLYRAVIDQFDVEHSHPGRYRPTPTHPDTRCNIFAGDVMRAMGAPLPTKGDIHRDHDPMTAPARDIYRALRNGWGGWKRIDIHNPDDLRKLLEHLKAGKPALACDPGHVAVLRPDHLPNHLEIHNLGELHIAEAGKHNHNDIPLKRAGYGTKFRPDFFIHE